MNSKIEDIIKKNYEEIADDIGDILLSLEINNQLESKIIDKLAEKFDLILADNFKKLTKNINQSDI